MPTSESRAAEAILDYLREAASSRSTQVLHLAGCGAVASLEDRLRRHYGMRHALCVSSATAGLHALALALDMKGREFITTPLTYGGTLAGLLHSGARPVFAGIDAQTLNLDAGAVARSVGPRTRMLLAVDLFGMPSETRQLRDVADAQGLFYVADAAQSLGATIDGLPASSLADAVVVSFTAGKTVFAGEGGAVLTNDARLHQRLVWLTQHPDRQRRDVGLHVSSAYNLNYRMHPVAAVWADASFEPALASLRVHRAHLSALTEALIKAGVANPNSRPRKGIEPSYFRHVVRLGERRSRGSAMRQLLRLAPGVALGDACLRLVPDDPIFSAQWGSRSRTQFDLASARRSLAQWAVVNQVSQAAVVRDGRDTTLSPVAGAASA